MLHFDLRLSDPQTALFRPRVCAVSYLNTLPLVWGMLHGRNRDAVDLQFAVPSECADRVASGAADIGIVPSVELPRLGLEIIRGTGIASRGAVRSILLVSKVEPGRIRRLAGDTSSRTSNMLARIILEGRYNCDPEMILLPPDLDAMLARADAALIIGDPALRIDPSALPFHVLDLGTEWEAMTGLPMVFAVWAGHRGVVTPQVADVFMDSWIFGREHLDDVLAEGERRHGIPAELGRRYLTRHIVNELGPREYEGLETYLRLAARIEDLNPSGRARA